MIDRSAAGPADDHHREAQHAREIGRGAVPADRRQQPGRPLDQDAVAAAAEGEVHLAHVLGVDGGDRVAAARCQEVLARVTVRGRADGAGHAPDQPARDVVVADLHGGEHGRGQSRGAGASREHRAHVRLADAVVGARDEHVQQGLGHERSLPRLAGLR